jgi:UDP-N-acetylmuramoyl-tripeptide--D-alanyl-D-alanine ligase
MSWTVDDILRATGGDLACGERRQRFDGIAIDSRRIASGEAFVAIRGTVHDGHAFIREVLARGVRGLVLERGCAHELAAGEAPGGPIACIAVADTTRALGDLGAYHRRRLAARVIAITGSNGKTSTRRLTAAVLSRRFAVLEPERNLNNQIGVPLTLFNLGPEHQWAVLELGTNMPGEIARLAEICRPDIGVIINIGPAHLEGLGSLDGVLKEKSALLSGLGPGGHAVLNADDPRLGPLIAEPSGRMLSFGLGESAAVRARRIQESARGLDFELLLPGARTAVHLDAFGRFMVHNALAAAAAGHLIGLGAEEIRAGLETFAPVAGRMSVSSLAGGIMLIDDTYNANPASMEGALAALTALRGSRRGILVAGDMRELGPGAAAMHREIGRLAARMNVAKLYACGELAAEVARGAAEAGLAAGDIVCGSREEILDPLLGELAAGDWVLVKGSRVMGMERIVRAIGAWSEDPRTRARLAATPDSKG